MINVANVLKAGGEFYAVVAAGVDYDEACYNAGEKACEKHAHLIEVVDPESEYVRRDVTLTQAQANQFASGWLSAEEIASL